MKTLKLFHGLIALLSLSSVLYLIWDMSLFSFQLMATFFFLFWILNHFTKQEEKEEEHKSFADRIEENIAKARKEREN
jgi:F0F1-type ATP synthase membrane subunit b/b'